MDALAQLNASLTGRYLIEREIGRGGMATVYLARDVRHARNVALKVLNAELGAVLGSERFLSEIQVTANLQHPNLLPLFDSGAADGLLFYVMPYVEGESLRKRLMREKQLPVHEAVHIATAVASALDYAHRHGVIHRDLKPENILLNEGQPLVADFGIALAVSKAGGERITQTGVSLGTPHYMSPEQATGDRVIDARTDLYSLGAVLYEMLSGDPPHTASTAQAVIAKVLTDRPRSVRLARPSVPEHVEAAIDRALEKLPADRFNSAHELAEALQGRGVAIPTGITTPGGLPRSGRRRAVRRVWRSPITWAAAFVIGTLVAAWGWLRPSPTVAPVRFALGLGATERLASDIPQPVAITPDGRSVIYVGALIGGLRQMFVRSLDELSPRALSHTASTPVVSPDGKWIAYFTLGSLRKVPIEGGAATTLAAAEDPYGITWLSNDEIAYARTHTSGLNVWAVSASGGEPRRLTATDTAAGDIAQAYPHAQPDAGLVFYTTLRSGFVNARIAVLSIKTGRTKVLPVNGAYALGLFFDHLVYVRDDGAMLAVPFNVRRLEVTGSPIPLLEGIQIVRAGAAAVVSPNGTLVFVRGSSTSQPLLVDERGVGRVLIPEKRRYGHPRFSPDGRYVAFDVVAAQSMDIWVADVNAGTFSKLTRRGANERPEWMPDGERIIYLSSDTTGLFGIWSVSRDGSSAPEQIYARPFNIHEVVATPDGRSLVFREDHTQNRRDIHLLPLDSPRVSRPLLTSGFDELMPRISPDGQWLAYMSDESGEFEIYVRSLGGRGGRFQVSANGGTEPLWSRDGRRLYYRNGTQLIAATLATTPSLGLKSRSTIFDATYESHPFHPNYDVAPDGKSFLMLKTADDDTQIIVVVNWLEELRQRLARR